MALRPHADDAYRTGDYDIAMREICARADAPLREDMRLGHPSEPIYEPRRRGSSMWRALVASLTLCACGWVLFKTQDTWMPVALELAHAVNAAMERGGRSQPGSQASVQVSSPPQDLPAEPLLSRDVAAAPGSSAGFASQHPLADGPAAGVQEAVADADATAAGESAAPSPDGEKGDGMNDGSAGPTGHSADGQGEVSPLPPPKVDPADPYQKRALAAGLHPELSRVLLKRLTDADYRNAREAIAKAISEVGDQETLLWPKQRVPKLALFKVHFVAGAPAECRRYVVVITKDGWSTTAPPMELCGVKRTARNAS